MSYARMLMEKYFKSVNEVLPLAAAAGAASLPTIAKVATAAGLAAGATAVGAKCVKDYKENPNSILRKGREASFKKPAPKPSPW